MADPFKQELLKLSGKSYSPRAFWEKLKAIHLSILGEIPGDVRTEDLYNQAKRQYWIVQTDERHKMTIQVCLGLEPECEHGHKAPHEVDGGQYCGNWTCFGPIINNKRAWRPLNRQELYQVALETAQRALLACPAPNAPFFNSCCDLSRHGHRGGCPGLLREEALAALAKVPK